MELALVRRWRGGADADELTFARHVVPAPHGVENHPPEVYGSQQVGVFHQAKGKDPGAKGRFGAGAFPQHAKGIVRLEEELIEALIGVGRILQTLVRSALTAAHVDLHHTDDPPLVEEIDHVVRGEA